VCVRDNGTKYDVTVQTSGIGSGAYGTSLAGGSRPYTAGGSSSRYLGVGDSHSTSSYGSLGRNHSNHDAVSVTMNDTT
jgi:hypothetical protein